MIVRVMGFSSQAVVRLAIGMVAVWVSANADASPSVVVTESTSTSGLQLFTLSVDPGNLFGQYDTISLTPPTGDGVVATESGAFNQVGPPEFPVTAGSDDSGLLPFSTFGALVSEDTTSVLRGGLASLVGNSISEQTVDVVQVVFAAGAEVSGTYEFYLFDNLSQPTPLAILSGSFGDVTSGLAGDYNDDGFVDGVDYAVWRAALGDTVAAGDGADGSGNGLIDEADFGIWQTNFGAGSTIGVVATPEPTSLALFCVCVASGVLSRRLRSTAC